MLEAFHLWSFLAGALVGWVAFYLWDIFGPPYPRDELPEKQPKTRTY